MLNIRPAHERGHANYGWLNTYHTFSFSSYQDPKHNRFRSLRVMNEDIVAPNAGFGTHPHDNMEIVTYVLSGALEHKDSMGHGEILHAGELQRMTAGTGITHSEFNPSHSEPVHLYQIWLYPEQQSLPPSYEQRRFNPEERRGRLQLVAARAPHSEALRIHQDAQIYLADVDANATIQYAIHPGRHVWTQVLRGNLIVNGVPLQTSDGLAVSDEHALSLQSPSNAELMLFDLA